MNINDIMEDVCRKGSIYNEIIDNILYPRLDLKDALISEVAIYWLNSPDNVVKAWNEGYFKYYFIMTIKNQVKSSTSAFHKNVRIADHIEYVDNYDESDDTEESINYKYFVENKLDDIENAKKYGGLKWIEVQLFNEYFNCDKTYREIEDDYGIDHCTVWKIVNKAKIKIENYLDDSESETK